MLCYLIFNALKFQLDLICFSFAPYGITIILLFWLIVVREKSTNGGGVISHSTGKVQQLNSIL